MANWYVRSLAGGTASGADWTNASLTLAAAFALGAAGDNFFVSEDHAETQASAMTNTSPGTVSNPCFIYCVDHAGSVPPVSANLRTTATITTTGSNNLINAGSFFCYGITFACGTGAVAATILLNNVNNHLQSYKSCALQKKGTTGAANAIMIGLSGTSFDKVVLDNTTMQFGSVGDSCGFANAWLEWKNTAAAIVGITLPTTLFFGNAGRPGRVTLEGVDLSALGSGNTIFGSITHPTVNLMKDCKLGASVTVAATPTGPAGADTIVSRSDSSGTNYRSEKYSYMGTETVETTIVRTGGASDGTTTIAKKIVTTANSKWVLPFEAIPIAIWNDTVGSPVTLTLFGIWGGGAVPNNDDIWMDVEYLGASGNPQGSFISASKADNLAAGVALTADGSTWGGSTTKFKMSVTFTPQQKGYVYVYVKAAKASSTFYIDPLAVLS